MSKMFDRQSISIKSLIFLLSVILASFSFAIYVFVKWAWGNYVLLEGIELPLEWIPSAEYYHAYLITGMHAGILGYLFNGVFSQKWGIKKTLAISLSGFTLLLLISESSYYTENIFLPPVLAPATHFMFCLAIPSFFSYIANSKIRRIATFFGISATILPFFYSSWALSIPTWILNKITPDLEKYVHYHFEYLVVAILFSLLSLIASRRFTESKNSVTYEHSTSKATSNANACVTILLTIVFALTLAEVLLESPDWDPNLGWIMSTASIFAILLGGVLADRLRKDTLLLLAIIAEVFVFIASPALSLPIELLVGFKMPIYYSMLAKLSHQGRAISLLAIGGVVNGIAFVFGNVLRWDIIHRCGIQTESLHFLLLLVLVVAATIPLVLKLRKITISSSIIL